MQIASLNLSQEEWNQLAEFAAVMDRAVRLCFTSQQDRVEVSGEMVLELANLKADYKFETEYSVVDTNSFDTWVPSAKYTELPRDIRQAKTTPDQGRKPLTVASQGLIERIIECQGEYFGELSDDRVISMVLNPILLSRGFDEMDLLEEGSGTKLLERGKQCLKDILSSLKKKTNNRDDDGSASEEGKH